MRPSLAPALHAVMSITLSTEYKVVFRRESACERARASSSAPLEINICAGSGVPGRAKNSAHQSGRVYAHMI